MCIGNARTTCGIGNGYSILGISPSTEILPHLIDSQVFLAGVSYDR